MKFVIALLSLVSVAYGGYLGGIAAPLAVGVANTGSSSVFRNQDNIGNYAFGYNEDHATGGTFRREQGGPGVQVGSYGLRDADGRLRTVNYVADAAGFRANIQTNEPGVDPSRDPAAVLINKGGLVGPIAAAPLVAPIAAPLAHGYGGYGGYGGYAGYAGHAGIAAPLAAAPILGASYSVNTHHVAAPIAHAAFAAPLAAPLAAGYAGYAGRIGW